MTLGLLAPSAAQDGTTFRNAEFKFRFVYPDG
jgi:hypothetical protein